MTRIVVLDTETTGKERSRDQIIELCIQLGLARMEETARAFSWRIKPSTPISPEAQAVHGITMADVEKCPSFSEISGQVVALLADAEVIIGYNVAFDLDMIQAELARAGLPPLDLGAKQVVDVLRLWHHVEPRTLAAAHEKFTGVPMTNAHAAGADVAATAHVLTAMLDRFGLADKPWPELAAIANPFEGRAKWIGPSHHIQWDADGNAVFGFGKNQNRRIDQTDPGFLRWVIDKDFPPHVKDICRAALQLPGIHLRPWLLEKFPRKQQEAA